MLSKIFKYLFLFFFGGVAYIIIELLWRGKSHVSMFFLGGLCFVVIGLINEKYTRDIPLILQMITGALAVTVLELISGCILNLKLGLNVWDYSDVPFNILGQVCLPYTLLWFLLAPVCIVADDYLRYAFFGEEKPRYRLF